MSMIPGRDMVAGEQARAIDDTEMMEANANRASAEEESMPEASMFRYFSRAIF